MQAQLSLLVEQARAFGFGQTGRAGLLSQTDQPLFDKLVAQPHQKILELLAARRHNGCAMLVATHSAAFAARADRIIEIRDGRVSEGSMAP